MRLLILIFSISFFSFSTFGSANKHLGIPTVKFSELNKKDKAVAIRALQQFMLKNEVQMTRWMRYKVTDTSKLKDYFMLLRALFIQEAFAGLPNTTMPTSMCLFGGNMTQVHKRYRSKTDKVGYWSCSTKIGVAIPGVDDKGLNGSTPHTIKDFCTGGKVRCNPFAFGWNNDGSFICVSPANRTTRDCKIEADKLGNTPEKIAVQILDKNLQDAFDRQFEYVNDYCTGGNETYGGEVLATNRLRGSNSDCSILMASLSSIKNGSIQTQVSPFCRFYEPNDNSIFEVYLKHEIQDGKPVQTPIFKRARLSRDGLKVESRFVAYSGNGESVEKDRRGNLIATSLTDTDGIQRHNFRKSGGNDGEFGTCEHAIGSTGNSRYSKMQPVSGADDAILIGVPPEHASSIDFAKYSENVNSLGEDKFDPFSRAVATMMADKDCTAGSTELLAVGSKSFPPGLFKSMTNDRDNIDIVRSRGIVQIDKDHLNVNGNTIARATYAYVFRRPLLNPPNGKVEAVELGPLNPRNRKTIGEWSYRTGNSDGLFDRLSASGICRRPGGSNSGTAGQQ